MSFFKHTMRLAFVVSCLLGAHGAMAQASASSEASSAENPQSIIPAEMQARYAHARWTYPTGDRLADLYPSKAQDERVSGAAVIVCMINTDGTMDRCAIAAEAPKGYGFGLATAQAFVNYTHVDPATVDGGIKPGDFKVFTYKWLLN